MGNFQLHLHEQTLHLCFKFDTKDSAAQTGCSTIPDYYNPPTALQQIMTKKKSGMSIYKPDSIATGAGASCVSSYVRTLNYSRMNLGPIEKRDPTETEPHTRCAEEQLLHQSREASHKMCANQASKGIVKMDLWTGNATVGGFTERKLRVLLPIHECSRTDGGRFLHRRLTTVPPQPSSESACLSFDVRGAIPVNCSSLDGN